MTCGTNAGDIVVDGVVGGDGGLGQVITNISKHAINCKCCQIYLTICSEPIVLVRTARQLACGADASLA